ncbi:MAG TPA: SDR family oxidoreductase [Candidatus Avimonoglobus intestinipullorum]|uniref:SDR family oxidoreductase n=1 Tax=Candidatus Avimonoglobus intestinipullorum TaxID=2840699 RepID=A0A9D1LUN3_9FIRM|nr:SDR family oxidoreductase [Candidatus Avimonoglobus intestinipullorum]
MKALITGASSGMGRDFARVLSGMGYELFVAARRMDRLMELKNELSTPVTPIRADLSVQEDCIALYDRLKNENIDLLINNAGFGLCGEFTELPLEDELRLIQTNVTGLHILTKLFLQDFVRRDSGQILNVSSSAGFMIGPLLSTYYASKAYVLRLSEGICEELRRKGSRVRIAVLCPGPVATEFDKVANVRFSIKGLSSMEVAQYAVRKLQQGKTVIVPGVLMKLTIFSRRFVSDKTIARTAYHIQHKKIR